MNQSFDLDARKDGERLWSRIQQSKLLVLPWNNPWRTLAKLSLVPLLSSAAAALTLKSHFPAILFALISLLFLVPALGFFIVARRTGSLYSFFSETGFGIGCDADRITIPYSALQLPQKVDRRTANKNCIALPVKAETSGVFIESKNGKAMPWDGKPYRRGIVSAYIEDGSFQVQASPNAMIVHLSSVIHPLSVYLLSQYTAPTATANGATAKPNGEAR
jgi:hypothetical protein